MSGSVSNTNTSTNTSTSGTAAAAASAATGSTKGLGIGASFDTFLTLLTTQLKNQDPTNAMDTNAMTQQLVSFASVEQQINMNSNLQSLIGLQQTNAVTSAAPMMGKSVEVASDQLTLQNGTATLKLPAKGAATSVNITIQDSTGRIVLKQEGVVLKDATSTWTWNGIGDPGINNGKPLSDGAYKVSVAGRDATNNPQPVTATVIGTATSTSLTPSSKAGSAGTLMLNLGALSVPFTAVRSVGG